MAGKCGWVKSFRKMEDSPVWRNHRAAIVFQWLLWHAASSPCMEYVGNARVMLKRGQLATRYENVAAQNHMSIDQARRAFAFLAGQGMVEWIGGRHGLVVTVVNYRRYQDAYAPQPECFGAEPEGAENGHETRTGSRRETRRKSAGNDITASDCNDNALPESENAERREDAAKDAGEIAGKPAANEESVPSSASTRARADAKLEEVKKDIIPPTPFKKGGASDSSDSSAMLAGDRERYELVLTMWREEREAAGLAAGLEGRPTLAAARKLAEEWLGAARMTAEQLRGGMRNLLAVIASERGCRNWGLNALARDPERYVPGKVIERPKRRRVRWLLVCDVCGYAFWTEYAPAGSAPPAPEACFLSPRFHCQGTMLLEKTEEVEI